MLDEKIEKERIGNFLKDKKLLSGRVNARSWFLAPKPVLLILEFANGCRYTVHFFGLVIWLGCSTVIKSGSTFFNSHLSLILYKMEVVFTI